MRNLHENSLMQETLEIIYGTIIVYYEIYTDYKKTRT